MPPEVDRVTVRVPTQDNARIELAMARLKLDKGRSVTKTDVFLELVAGFLDGRFQLPAFEGLDVAAIVRDADGA